MTRENLTSFRGLKGKSELHDLIDNLPFTAPHGVTRALMYVIKHRHRKSQVDVINKTATRIQLPREFKRAMRSLDKLDHCKSNELKLWLLYVGPVLFREILDFNMFERFHLLSYFIRLLVFSTKNCDGADVLIKRFDLLTSEAYGENVFSANINSLNHLAWQIRCFGPLWCTSAMMFESKNYLLRCKFTGSVDHLRLLLERYLRNKNCSKQNPRHDILFDMCNKLRNHLSFNRKPLLVSEVPDDLRILFNAKYFGNQKFNNFVIDAAEISCPNSFVSFYFYDEKLLGQVLVFFEEGR